MEAFTTATFGTCFTADAPRIEVQISVLLAETKGINRLQLPPGKPPPLRISTKRKGARVRRRKSCFSAAATKSEEASEDGIVTSFKTGAASRIAPSNRALRHSVNTESWGVRRQYAPQLNHTGNGQASREQLWQEFFHDPSEWWDNRAEKTNPNYPDFKHKRTKEALWVDGWSNPLWVKEELAAMSQSHTHLADSSSLKIQNRKPGQQYTRAAGSVRRDGTGSRDKPATGIEQQQIKGVDMPLSDGRGKIRALTESGQPAEVLQSLEQRGIRVDASTYKLLLRRSTHTKDLVEGRKVHLHIIKTGFKPDVYLSNAVLNMFCKCGSLVEARKVFDAMQVRDTISWTLILAVYAKHGSNREAYLLYEQLRDQGFKCDMLMYTSIVSACARLGDLEKAKAVHSDIIQSGITTDVFLKSNLVHMYVRCGSLVEARKVFDAMQERAATTWTFMLAGYAKQGLNREAFKLYEQVQNEGVRSDKIMYTSIVSVCASLGDLEKAKTVHNDMIKSGIRTDVILESNLVHMYTRCGSMELAHKVFHKMAERNVVSWNAMIAGSVENGNCEEAFEVFRQMQHESVQPDYVTFINLLNACASPEALKQGQWVHQQIASAGLETDVHVGNALITMFVKCSSIQDARQVFDNMKVRDVISWSAMIEGYAVHGPYEKALEVFQQLQSASVKPNKVTFVGLLKACANRASLQSARLVHTWIAAAGLESDLRVGNGLINMYAKCGSVKDALNTFNTMPEKDLVTWSTMIVGLGQHGYAAEGLKLFHQLISEGVKPDGVVFVGVLSACSHAGLVDEGLQYFFSMSRVHSVSPSDEHFGCVVDLLGRAGHLDEAEDFVNKMPQSPGGATWGAVLGACRLHGNVKLAERAADICFELEPQNAAVYMSLSHVYATAGLWNKATSLRKLMKERGIKKEAGRSWIEVANKTDSFTSGDTAHPRIAEIWSELDKLTREMEDAGYVPDTRWVMQDVDEQKSRQILRCHSEKLAIAFGLISSPPGSIIHIWKNLRICGDCHTAKTQNADFVQWSA